MFGPLELGRPRRELGNFRSGGDWPKVLLDELPGPVGLEIADDRQARVTGRVICAEERRDIVAAGGRQIGHRADHAVVVGMVGRIHRGEHLFHRLPVRHIVNALPALVLDHVALIVELLLGQGGEEEAHPVRLEPQSQLQSVRRQGLEVIGPIGVRAAVDLSAKLLDRSEILLVVMLRALEHQVLEQVGKARAPGFSFFEPTLYQIFTPTTGVLWSSSMTTSRPLGSVYFSTFKSGTCGCRSAARAPAGSTHKTIAASNVRQNRSSNLMVLLSREIRAEAMLPDGSSTIRPRIGGRPIPTRRASEGVHSRVPSLARRVSITGPPSPRIPARRGSLDVALAARPERAAI